MFRSLWIIKKRAMLAFWFIVQLHRFMFQITMEEVKDWISQIVISNTEKMGLRKPPLVFSQFENAKQEKLELENRQRTDLTGRAIIVVYKTQLL